MARFLQVSRSISIASGKCQDMLRRTGVVIHNSTFCAMNKRRSFCTVSNFIVIESLLIFSLIPLKYKYINE